MESTINTLVEIPHSEWPKLRDLYVVKKLFTCAYNMLQTAIDCIEQNPQLDLRIYALNGDWESDGTFVLEDHDLILFNTLSDNQERLILALNCMKTKTEYVLYGFSECFLSAVEQHFIGTGFKREEVESDGGFWHHIPRETVEKFEINPPVGVTLGKLDASHAEIINNNWPHKEDDSLRYIQRLIQYNINVGAFDKDGQLMAWCLLLPVGALGVLQVLPEHRRKGLDKLVVRSMAKKLLSKNMEVLAPVVFTNVASLAMFKSLGANILDKAYWATKPMGKTV